MGGFRINLGCILFLFFSLIPRPLLPGEKGRKKKILKPLSLGRGVGERQVKRRDERLF